MGFSSTDDFVSEVTQQGKFWRNDWNKITGAGAYTAGRWYDLSLLAGTPVANTYAGTALAATVPDESTGWGLYHGGNVSTDTKHLINMAAYSAVATAVPSVLMLVDVVLYYPGINMNSATRQTLTNSTTLTRYTDGKGLRSFLVPTVATGATAHNIDNTASTGTEYVDTADVASVHPGTISCTASAIVGHLTHSGTAANNFGPFMPLKAGGTGIKKYNYFKLSAASLAGTAALVLCKPLATLPLVAASVESSRDLMNQLPSLPQIKDGACLSWLYFAGAATAASTNIYGSIEVAWG